MSAPTSLHKSCLLFMITLLKHRGGFVYYLAGLEMGLAVTTTKPVRGTTNAKHKWRALRNAILGHTFPHMRSHFLFQANVGFQGQHEQLPSKTHPSCLLLLGAVFSCLCIIHVSDRNRSAFHDVPRAVKIVWISKSAKQRQ